MRSKRKDRQTEGRTDGGQDKIRPAFDGRMKNLCFHVYDVGTNRAYSAVTGSSPS